MRPASHWLDSLLVVALNKILVAMSRLLVVLVDTCLDLMCWSS